VARPAASPALIPSLIDRLIDPESLGTVSLRGYTPQQMLESVRRDLEDLFNTHQAEVENPEGLEEVGRSIVAFGLPDLPSISERTGGDPEALRRLLLDVITRFEPRLRDVRVTVAGSFTQADRRLRLRIEARLNVEPSPDVALETVLELTTGQAMIRKSEG
jgi:type VI secretion system protein ImpF